MAHAYPLSPSKGLPSGVKDLRRVEGCLSVEPVEILHSEGPFEVAS